MPIKINQLPKEEENFEEPEFENLKDAFEKCETYYQEVISNPSHLEQLVRQKAKIEMEEDMRILAI